MRDPNIRLIVNSAASVTLFLNLHGWLLNVAYAAQPSFDCSKARSWSELEVCRDETLIGLDAKLASLYRDQKARLDGLQKDALIVDQRRWLAEREKCKLSNSTSECLIKIYSKRLTEISSSQSVEVESKNQPTNLPPERPSTATVKTVPEASVLSSSAARLTGTHEYICKTYLFHQPYYYDDCMTDNQFASEHPDIKKSCVEKGSAKSNSGEAINEYTRCLRANRQQLQVDEISRFIEQCGAKKVVNVKQLIQNPFPLKGMVVAVVGSWDRFVSESEALFGSSEANGFSKVKNLIIITNAPVDKMEPGNCVLVGTVTGMKSIQGLGGVSVSNIDFGQRLMPLLPV